MRSNLHMAVGLIRTGRDVMRDGGQASSRTETDLPLQNKKGQADRLAC